MGGQEDKTDYGEEGSFQTTARASALGSRAESNSGIQDQADSAAPGIHRVAGAEGLYLKVGDNGKGSWFWRYRFAGRRREIGLGSRDRVTLVEARDAAKDQDALRRKNIDPIEQRRLERADAAVKARAAKPVTFREMTDRYVDEHSGFWRHRYARAHWLTPVAKYALPRIGHLSVDAIEIADVSAAIKATEAAGAAKTGPRLRMRIEQVLNFAIAKGLRSANKINPADSKLHQRRKFKRDHYRAVDLDDAPEIFRELRAQAETHSVFGAWAFMILCASRPSEALNAQWAEVDLEKKLWTVPASRMKSDHEHKVPLSPLALEVLDRQARISTGDSIFPGRSGSPISYAAFATAPAKAGIGAATPHGWRSVFRDFCGDVADDVPRDLAEAALAHSLGSTEASYRRRTAVEKRRSIMELYSRWLLDDGRKVISFPTTKKA